MAGARDEAALAAGDPAARVLRRFRLVFNSVKSHFREVEKKAGISGAQVWALSVVRDHPGISVGELARAMDIHQSTASNLLRALMEAGLVGSDRGTEDRRAVLLKVTPRGRKALAKVPGPHAGMLPDALARLDPATLARLDRDLAKVIKELGVDSRGASVPLGARDE
jgi:DNA-binding MarR family transcriptional regulator